MKLTRRRMFQTLALAPAGALLSQEGAKADSPESLAAMNFVSVADRAYSLIKSGDTLQARDARVEASTAFSSMALFLTDQSKNHMTEILRSYEAWWPQNLDRLPPFYRGYRLGTDDEIKSLFAPDIELRESAIAFLDFAGIEGFLECYWELMHPDRQRFIPKPKRRLASSSFGACGGGAYEDGFFAGIGVIGASLGIAAMAGCIPCGAVGMGMGFGAAILKAARTISCMGGEKK